MNSGATPRTPDRATDDERPAPHPPESAGADANIPSPGLRLDRYDNSGFDRGAGRIKEGLWVLCKCVFFLNPLPWPSALRTGLLRVFGARIGRGVVIRSGTHITFPWRLTLGDHVWIGEEVLILSLAPVTVGSNVCVSQRVFLCTGSHAWRRETFDLQTRPIAIGDSVWISAQAFIGPGVEVGNGSVISAAAVVMKSVPENSVARAIRPRLFQNFFCNNFATAPADPAQI